MVSPKAFHKISKNGLLQRFCKWLPACPDGLQEVQQPTSPSQSPGRGGWGAGPGWVSQGRLSRSSQKSSSGTFSFPTHCLQLQLESYKDCLCPLPCSGYESVLLFFFMLCLPFSYPVASFDTNKNQNKIEQAFLLPIKIWENWGSHINVCRITRLVIGRGTNWMQRWVLFCFSLLWLCHFTQIKISFLS